MRVLEAVRSRPTFSTVLGIIVLGFLIYGGAIGASFTFFDDDVYVTRNPLIQEFSLSSIGHLFTAFSNCNYHPLTDLTWMAEYSVVGTSPWLYHLNNVLLHLGVTVIVFFLGRRLLLSVGPAALAALLFLVHPLRVESVAWIAERKDVLCAFFYLSALLAYLNFLDEGYRKRDYALSLLLFLAALLSKAMAISLPAVLVLFLLYRRESTRKQHLLLLPFWGLSVVFAVLAYLAQLAFEAVQSIHGGNLYLHLLTIPKALAIYAQKLVYPHPLSPRYVIEPASGLLDPQALAGIFLMAAGLWASWRSLRGRRLVLLGVGFFLVTWSPVSGIVPTSTVVADRYMYLPALGLLWPLCAVVVERLRSPATGKRHHLAWSGLVGLLVFLLAWGVLARQRVLAWQDGVVLWKDALEENPRNPYAYSQLATEYQARGEYEKSVTHTVQSIRLGLKQPRFLYNLCLGYRSLGEHEKELLTAKGIIAGAPDFLPAWMVVLRHLREQGELDACAKRVEELLADHPDSPPLLTERGELRAERGELEDALRDYLAVLRQQPNDRYVLLGAGRVLAEMGDTRGAVRLATKAISLEGSVLWPWELEQIGKLNEILEMRHPGLLEEATEGDREKPEQDAPR